MNQTELEAENERLKRELHEEKAKCEAYERQIIDTLDMIAGLQGTLKRNKKYKEIT